MGGEDFAELEFFHQRHIGHSAAMLKHIAFHKNGLVAKETIGKRPQQPTAQTRTRQRAAYFSQVVYGEKMKMPRGLINFEAMRAKGEGYTQDMWDYHHSDEFAKKRISYKNFVRTRGSYNQQTIAD
jgi:hypothetical protein